MNVKSSTGRGSGTARYEYKKITRRKSRLLSTIQNAVWCVMGVHSHCGTTGAFSGRKTACAKTVLQNRAGKHTLNANGFKRKRKAPANSPSNWLRSTSAQILTSTPKPAKNIASSWPSVNGGTENIEGQGVPPGQVRRTP